MWAAVSIKVFFEDTLYLINGFIQLLKGKTFNIYIIFNFYKRERKI